MASVGLSFGVRTTPDVSFNADPNSGVSVYDSVSYDGQSGWFTLGGTSAAAPAWAGLVAITDQGLATAGQGSLSTTQVLSDLYSLPSSDYNAVTTGFNGYRATSGYNLVTGLGTPKANLVVSGVLAANGVSTNSVKATATPTPTATLTPTSTSGHHATTRTTHSGSASKADQISSTTAASGSSTQFASTSPGHQPDHQFRDHGSRVVGDDCYNRFHSISTGFEFLKQARATSSRLWRRPRTRSARASRR